MDEEERGVGISVPRVVAANQTPEQLVSRAIAPVKKEFLRPPPVRSSAPDNDVSIPNENKTSVLAKEKKSKRQLKRERRQVQKSAKNLCPQIAKTGDVSSCLYKDKCRFSHDLEGFKAQKPSDLDGQCPFVKSGVSCPYGLTCRFSSTHEGGVPSGVRNGPKNSSEVNGLSKEVQKLLWKNKMTFSKADAKLKSLGLLGSSKSIRNDLENKEGVDTGSNKCDHSDDSGSCVVTSDSGSKLDCPAEVMKDGENDIDGKSESDELCPLKRRKTEENCGPEEAQNEENCGPKESKNEGVTEKIVERRCTKSEADAIVPETDISLKPHSREKKLIDFRGKLYLAPLTTVGNLPFRRVCKELGADVTCGEMAMCTNLLQGQASEWALLRRHSSEDFFGVQICGAYPDTVARTVELIEQECTVDFIDINMGCPIDIVVNKGAGSALLTKPTRMKSIVEVASGTVDKPITIKVRTAYFEGKKRIDSLIADIGSWGASAVTIHGRSRQQRYSKLADWDYVYQCARKAPTTLPVVGNGDVFSFVDWNNHRTECPELATDMIARGALVKPWIFTEIKEQRHWDISSGERLNILKDFVNFGLEHWGSDTKGVETTRRFLLEWLSYTCRYVPVGLLDVVPQRLNWRPPSYYGRDELETLMASDSAADWVCSSLSFQIINSKSLSVNFFREIEFMERYFLSCAASNSRTSFFFLIKHKM
ncbi:tRNA-dihydrouridine(47) synthase [NAD(P)(+)]-like isoform X1 [Vigna umbellata]|uniref:tRNA-dihydrouridine(47) synthase [NAD(P)(+)]-like isoform X1 n=1 Tax=Vigna umbellata TaxID=87088 RepID=UPI001F5FB3AB|nr:tRNA-dihydrouridine(47) synthase [NAD(P)(+)]-like isoform X1 [Vigna umbellata]